jgi:hypothetical protein
MYVEIFILCDSFKPSKTLDGQMVWSIIGPFESVKLVSLPAQISFTVIAAIRFERFESGEHEVQVCLTDSDSQTVIDCKTKNPVKTERKFKTPDTSSSHCEFSLWSAGLPGTVEGGGGVWIERPGDYYFDLKIDGKHSGRIPLHVAKIFQL